MRACRHGETGQTTVEFALCLPIVALVLGGVFEVGMIGLDQLRLWHASREAARVAVVDPDANAAEQAAARSGLRPIEMTIDPPTLDRTTGEPLTVDLRYRPTGRVPLIGEMFDDLTLTASATMRIERP